MTSDEYAKVYREFPRPPNGNPEGAILRVFNLLKTEMLAEDMDRGGKPIIPSFGRAADSEEAFFRKYNDFWNLIRLRLGGDKSDFPKDFFRQGIDILLRKGSGSEKPQMETAGRAG